MSRLTDEFYEWFIAETARQIKENQGRRILEEFAPDPRTGVRYTKVNVPFEFTSDGAGGFRPAATPPIFNKEDIVIEDPDTYNPCFERAKPVNALARDTQWDEDERPDIIIFDDVDGE